MRYRALLVTVVACGVLFTMGPVHAQKKKAAPTTEDPVTLAAREAFIAGTSAVKAGQWSEALVHFEKADQLKPAPVVTFNIGYCQRALGRYILARSSFRKVLSDPSGLPEAQLEEARALLESIETQVLARVTITLLPSSARIAIDGRPLLPYEEGEPGALVAGVAPAGEGTPPPSATLAVVIDPAVHLIQASRPGHEDVLVTKSFQPNARELRQAVSVNIAPVELVQVRGEEHNPLPLFDPNAGSWRRGAKLKQLIAEECTGTGLAVPSSIRLTSQPGAAETFVADTDYVVDAFWAQIGRIEGGAIAPDQAVYVDYDYYPTRVDSILVDASGGVRVAQGKPGVGNIHLPEPGTGEVAVCTVWHNGILAGLEPENVFPIQFAATSTAGPAPSAERLLPKTLAKLRNGEPVTIVAWGDSVTNGGGRQAGQDALWLSLIHI